MTPESPVQEQPTTSARTFAEVFGLLLKAQAKEDPRQPGGFIEPTNQQIADAINGKHGEGTIHPETIRRLRNGTVKSPSVQIASAIASFFQLPLDVFNAIGSDTSEKVVEEVQRFLGLRRPTIEAEPPTVAALARMTRRLSPNGQQRVARFAAQLHEVESMEAEANTTQGPPPD